MSSTADTPTAVGGSLVLVRRGIAQISFSVLGLTYWEATAIQVLLAGRKVKILAACLSPLRPMIEADLTACFG